MGILCKVQYRFLNGNYRTFFPLHFEWISRSLLLAFSFLRGAGLRLWRWTYLSITVHSVFSSCPPEGDEYQTYNHTGPGPAARKLPPVLSHMCWTFWSMLLEWTLVYYSEKTVILSPSLYVTIHRKTRTKWDNKQQLVAHERLCKLGTLCYYSCNDTQHSSQDAFPSVPIIWSFLFLFLFSFFPPIQLLSQWNTNKCIHKVVLFDIRIQEGLGYIYSYEINSMD